jgi:septum formation protein
MKRLILASGSPRRKELLTKIGLQFEVQPADYDESQISCSDPCEMAKNISLAKARAVAERNPDAVIIAADTFGCLEGILLGKPQTADEAERMLRALSGKPHQVITGFTIIDMSAGKTVTRSVETTVYFRDLSAAEITAYINTGEPMDKAGAYAIQGLGAVLVDRIEGDFYNIIGLPLSALVESLKEFGIRVLD